MRFRILAFGAGALAFLACGAQAQTFSHSHGDTGYHSHDTTIYVTEGSCCQITVCDSSHHSHSHTHTYTHSHPVDRVVHHPAPVHRTYTRTYVHPHTVTRTYTRTVHPAPRVVHRVYHAPVITELHGAPPPSHDHNPHPSYLHDHGASLHNDRDQAWAHYDRHWKRRTNSRRHKHD